MTRLNLNIDDSTRERLESLAKRSGGATLTDVVKRALHLYDLVLANQQRGGEAVLKDQDGTEKSVVII